MAKGPAPEAEFNAEVYRNAAADHLSRLSRLYELRYYSLAIYLAGLSVECMFRAYRSRIAPEFDARHDLHELYKAARFYELLPAERIEQYSASLSTVATRWSNNHRYRSEQALRAYYKRVGLHRGIKGDVLKENARRIISAAAEIVSIGLVKWKTSSRQ